MPKKKKKYYYQTKKKWVDFNHSKKDKSNETEQSYINALYTDLKFNVILAHCEYTPKSKVAWNSVYQLLEIFNNSEFEFSESWKNTNYVEQLNLIRYLLRFVDCVQENK